MFRGILLLLLACLKRLVSRRSRFRPKINLWIKKTSICQRSCPTLVIAESPNNGHSHGEVSTMFEPEKDSPQLLKAIYPYWVLLRNDRKMFFKVLTGRGRFYWHYRWETEHAENNSVDHPDFRYLPGSFIRYHPESVSIAENENRK